MVVVGMRGCACRWYAGAVEAAALADLQQVALAAHAARTLPPAGLALLTAHIEEDSGFGGGTEEAAKAPPARDAGSPWPPLIKREFAVKLNNLQEASSRTEALARKVAQHLSLSEDPLLAAHATVPLRAQTEQQPQQSCDAIGAVLQDPIKSASPDLRRPANKGRGRVSRSASRAGSEVGRVSTRVSMEQLAVAAEMRASASLHTELSFMSEGVRGSLPGSDDELEVRACTLRHRIQLAMVICCSSSITSCIPLRTRSVPAVVASVLGFFNHRTRVPAVVHHLNMYECRGTRWE